MKIATINLNGEAWFLISRKQRLPKTICDQVKTDLINLLIEGLNHLLDTNTYDVIAFQELVYIQNNISEIRKKNK